MAQTQDWCHRKHDERKTAVVDTLTTISTAPSTAPISPFLRQKKIRILTIKKGNVSENKAQLV